MFVPACTTGPEEAAVATESDLGTIDPSAVVGTIGIGTTTGGTVSYTSTPKYRALAFAGTAGETMDAWVRSTDGDAMAWITDSTFKALGRNDDASPTTHDAHVIAKLEKTGKHYIVMRERDFEPATFRVFITRSLDALPSPGTPCTTQDQIAKRSCGFCGQQATVCEADASGALTWSELGPCSGEHGVCAAGENRERTCGNCGHHVETCTSYCQWDDSATCSDGFDTGCSPLTFDLTNAGCSDPFQFRARTCSYSCSYDPYGACQAPPTTIEVGRTVGTLSSTVLVLDGSLAPLGMGQCPAVILGYAGSTFAYTKVHNPNPTPMTVSIFHSKAPGGTVFETDLAVYESPEIPTTVAERLACLRTGEYGNASLTGDIRFSSIDWPSERITIPAGATYVVYSRPEVNTPAMTQKLAVRLTVKTEAVGD